MSPGRPAGVLARVRRLRERRVRERQGVHFVEGVREVVQAIEAGIGVETIVHSRILLKSAAAQRAVRLARRADVSVTGVTPEAFRSISRRERASGIGAIVRQHWTRLERADPRAGTCWVVVSRIRSPGNLGTIVRTAEAAGAGGLILLGGASDPFDGAVVRASLGGLFRLRLVRTTLPQFTVWTRRHGCRVVGMSPAARDLYTDVPVAPPLAVMLGEERRGLTAAELSSCTHLASIPIVGRADSLNVGAAASVMLYEVLRRR